MSRDEVQRQTPGPDGPEMLRNIALMRRRPPEFLARCAARYGSVVRFPIPRSEVFLISDPSDIRRVLQTNHKAYGKRTVQYDTLALVTGSGLLTSDAELWRRMRRLLSPAFHHDLVDDMAATVQTVTARWVEQRFSTGGESIDLDAEMLDLSLQIVAETLLGTAVSGQLNQRENTDRIVTAVMDALHIVVGRAQRPLRLPERWPVPSHRRLRAALQVLDRAVADVIAARRAMPAGSDALSLLLQARDAGLATEREVRDEVVTLIVAGHETVAATLTWTWVLLATNRGAQSRVVAEADALPSEAPWGSDVLAALPFTRAVIDECLRLYPPAWVVTRRSLEPDVLSGHEIPQNSTLILSPYAVHRDERWWPNPHHFDPRRFLTSDGERRSREEGSGPLTYFPFGAGPRLCIGRDMALVEAPIVMATLLRAIQVRPVRPRRVTLDFGVTLRPQGGPPALVTPRPQPHV